MVSVFWDILVFLKFSTGESFFNGLVSMYVSDFLQDSDQIFLIEHRFSSQNISFDITRENHKLFVTSTQGKKCFKTGENQGILREN